MVFTKFWFFGIKIANVVMEFLEFCQKIELSCCRNGSFLSVKVKKGTVNHHEGKNVIHIQTKYVIWSETLLQNGSNTWFQLGEMERTKLNSTIINWWKVKKVSTATRWHFQFYAIFKGGALLRHLKWCCIRQLEWK